MEMPLREVLARWDALAVRWGLEGDECSSLLGVGPGGPVEDVSSYGLPGAERRMRLLIALEPVLDAVLGDDERIRAWLRHPNVNLRDHTPLQVMSQSPEWISWLIAAVGVAS
jgi:hypothetical protein